MAHVEHFKKPDIKRVVNEYERDANYTCRDGRIDPKRTPNNYVMDDTVTDYNERFEKRFNEIKHSNRKDLNVISDWVITCPQELKDNDKDRERFFELSYQFVKDRYGEENVMQGYVHMDETTPHMHVSIIPEKDGTVSAKKLFTRAELRSFHSDLNKIMEHEFNMPNLVLNGRTKGNYTVQECKERDKQERELQEKQISLQEQEQRLNARESDLDARESVLKREQLNFYVRESVLKQDEKDLDVRESDLDARESVLKQGEKDLALRQLKWRKTQNTASEALDKRAEELEQQTISNNAYAQRLQETINQVNAVTKRQAEKEEEFQRWEDALQAQQAAADARDKQLTARERALIPQERFQDVVNNNARRGRALPDISNISL